MIDHWQNYYETEVLVVVLTLEVLLFCDVLAKAIALLDWASRSITSELLLSMSPIDELAIAVALLLAPSIFTDERAVEELLELLFLGRILRRDRLGLCIN